MWRHVIEATMVGVVVVTIPDDDFPLYRQPQRSLAGVRLGLHFDPGRDFQLPVLGAPGELVNQPGQVDLRTKTEKRVENKNALAWRRFPLIESLDAGLLPLSFTNFLISSLPAVS